MSPNAKSSPWVVPLACLAWLGLSVGLYWRNYPHSPSMLPLIPLGLLALLISGADTVEWNYWLDFGVEMRNIPRASRVTFTFCMQNARRVSSLAWVNFLLFSL